MNTIELPALSGDTPLGFLAALGLLRLLDMYTDDTPRLSWSPSNLTAQLHTTCIDIDDIVGRLQTIVENISTPSVLPGISVEFPPNPSAKNTASDIAKSTTEENTEKKKKEGDAGDPLRLSPPKLRSFIETIAPEPDAEIEAWLTSLVTDISVDEKGRSSISLMAAPSGRQTMYSMLSTSLVGQTSREKSIPCIKDDPKRFFREALDAWQRYAGVTGEYLDHQVLYSAADSFDGQSSERGVPGATWLALMSFPLLRTTASGSQPVTTCWYRRTNRSPVFAYPLWDIPLDRYAITALLEHPLIRQHLDEDVPAELKVLSVFTVEHALRHLIPGRKSAGALKHVPQQHHV